MENIIGGASLSKFMQSAPLVLNYFMINIEMVKMTILPVLFCSLHPLTSLLKFQAHCPNRQLQGLCIFQAYFIKSLTSPVVNSCHTCP